MDTPGKRHEIGFGKINWPESEEKSRRYGLVSLHKIKGGPVRLKVAALEGKSGRLMARLLTGKEVVLGEGKVIFPDSWLSVGVVPLDDRQTFWLNMRLLEPMRKRTVVLFFEEGMTADQ